LGREGNAGFPNSFTTARLRAERLTPEAWDAVRQMDSDPSFMSLLGGVRSEEETREYMDRNLKHWDTYGFGLWILHDTTDQIIGRGAIRHLDVEGTDEVELGYGFYPAYWGQGLATEIAKTFLAVGLTELRLATMVGITRHANIGSQRVLEKTGLVYERDIVEHGVPHMLYRYRSL
jgi:RimJ/RimL family protein N-acetyltransferase